MNGAPVIRLGVAGLGRAFSLMLPTFTQDPRIRLVAACDPRQEARDQFTSDFAGATYTDVEALAADPAVDVVYVATPHGSHAANTRAAALRGKHVLVEKPMALTLDECDQMIADCQSAGVQLIVGHCHSFDAQYATARQVIDKGDVGRVRRINALNYTDFLYRPRRPEELQTGAGGGVVFSQAAHQIDIVRMLAGSRVCRVRAVTGAWDLDRPTEGAYTALLWFEDGCVATLVYSGYGHFDSDEWCDWIGEMGIPKQPEEYGLARRRLASLEDPAQEARLKASGTYGGTTYRRAQPQDAAFHQHFGPILVSCDRADLRPGPNGVWIYGDRRKELIPLPSPRVPRYEVVDELHSALFAGKHPLHDGAWGRATLEACLALLESGRAGRDVDLPLS